MKVTNQQSRRVMVVAVAEIVLAGSILTSILVAGIYFNHDCEKKSSQPTLCKNMFARFTLFGLLIPIPSIIGAMLLLSKSTSGFIVSYVGLGLLTIALAIVDAFGSVEIWGRVLFSIGLVSAIIMIGVLTISRKSLQW